MTVTSQVAVFSPSSVVTVIVAVPSATPVTKPFWSTVAFVSSLLLHATFLLDASEGAIVAVSLVVLPTLTVSVFLSSVTPVTGTVTPVSFTNK